MLNFSISGNIIDVVLINNTRDVTYAPHTYALSYWDVALQVCKLEVYSWISFHAIERYLCQLSSLKSN